MRCVCACVRCVCAVSVGVVCLYLFRLVFTPLSLLLSSLHLLFSSLSYSLLLFCLFCFFCNFFSLLDAVSQKKPLTFHNVSIFFLLLAAISIPCSHVDFTQHVRMCLKLRREANIDGHVVEGQRHHLHHMQPSPCVVVVCDVVLCCVWKYIWCLWCGL